MINVKLKTKQFEELFNKDKFQVFVFSCPASIPLNFARHPWFVVNKKGSISRWEVFWRQQKTLTSWGHLHKDFYSPIQGISTFSFFEKSFWNKIKLLGMIEGDEGSVAEQMTCLIEDSPQVYQYCYWYSFFGPNSNTYVQWVLNKFPEFDLKLSWNYFAKSWQPKS